MTRLNLFIGSRGTVAKGRYCHVGEDIADAATIINSLHRPEVATEERPFLSPYLTQDDRAATKTMEREVELVVDVSDPVRRRLLLK